MDQQAPLQGHALGMARLYGLSGEPEHPAQVPLGHLPKRSRKDAPAWENAARQRMRHLLDPETVVSEAERMVLADAQIPLKPRPNRAGYHIDPAVARHSDDTRAAAHVSNATGIARLYGLTREPEHPAQAPLGHLPTQSRKDAPAWEKTARQRMHNLLNPASAVSEAEGKVLADAQIPLKPRPQGAGYYIDPAVARHSEDTRAAAHVSNATGIARLYGLTREPEYPAQVPLGHLPMRRKDAPAWEKAAQQRMHHLLHPASAVISEAEMKVLADAQIPLKPRPQGAGYYIDPVVPRYGDDTRAAANVSNALGMARLYGLSGEPEYPAQVPLGHLPTQARKDAPAWEKAARQRMRNLLNPAKVVSEAEGKVLADAQIPLKPRPQGAGYHIDPTVARHSEDTRAAANVSNATGIARLYGLTREPEHPAQVPLGHLPTGIRNDAPAWEKAARQRMRNLLNPVKVVSEAEGKVLADAQIPLKPRPQGAGYYIDPAVPRQRDFLSGVVVGGVQPGLGLPGAGAAQSWSGAAVPLPGVLPASDEAQNPVGNYLVSAAGSGQFSSPQAGHQPGPSQEFTSNMHRREFDNAFAPAVAMDMQAWQEFNQWAQRRGGQPAGEPAAPPGFGAQDGRHGIPGPQFPGGYESSRPSSQGRRVAR
ncbi:DUF3827 domain-containing protein [Streptomyces sp. NBC_01723]|uniref:hypothetical protein n=1 Tax=Streptomyces sp. NBC_01723 TaxID=2975921 RepID=UPI002E37353B|nr:hypothetical protein [Streptomyces sp. NBC_01723]